MDNINKTKAAIDRRKLKLKAFKRFIARAATRAFDE